MANTREELRNILMETPYLEIMYNIDEAVDYLIDNGVTVSKHTKDQPTADVVEVKHISEKIIRRQADVSGYWQNDVKSYRAMQGYSDIEHDVDNFLRGYNEAVEDILAILDGTKERGGENG